jgi:hypothetical protein
VQSTEPIRLRGRSVLRSVPKSASGHLLPLLHRNTDDRFTSMNRHLSKRLVGLISADIVAKVFLHW